MAVFIQAKSGSAVKNACFPTPFIEAFERFGCGGLCASQYAKQTKEVETKLAFGCRSQKEVIAF